jgi:hypothetical protein
LLTARQPHDHLIHLMRTSFRRLIPLLLLLLGGLTLAAWPREPQPAGRLKDVQVGMSAQQVRDLLGPPMQTGRQVFYQGYLEQWIYEHPEPARIDLLCRLGKEPQVQAIHRLNQPRR